LTQGVGRETIKPGRKALRLIPSYPFLRGIHGQIASVGEGF
jgi:hypothetical protein